MDEQLAKRQKTKNVRDLMCLESFALTTSSATDGATVPWKQSGYRDGRQVIPAIRPNKGEL